MLKLFEWSNKNISFSLNQLDLQAQDPQYYALITSKLDADQQKGLNDVIVTAEQKKAQYSSKLIQKQGGNDQSAPLIMV